MRPKPMGSSRSRRSGRNTRPGLTSCGSRTGSGMADTIDKERAKRDQKIQALKDRYAARDAAGREKRAVREYQQKIRRTALDLSRRLLNPTDSKHIPESLRGPVAAFLSSIDFSGKKQDTKIAEVWAEPAKQVAGIVRRAEPGGFFRGIPDH